ncbi:MAG: alpha/beta fold hydrolase [Pseudomonadota bacterium]
MPERDPRRQFLERMTVFPSGEAMLEGLFHTGDRTPPCLVAPPHPQLGGSMDSPVCAELCWTLSQQRLPTLRFNYQGVGASTGQSHGDQRDVEDLRAALGQLRETTAVNEVAVVGYSFGAFLAAQLAQRDHLLAACVLVAPPGALFPFDWEALGRATCPVLVLLAEHDVYCDATVATKMAQAAGLTVRTIRNADHFFSRGLFEVGRLTAEVLSESAG